MVPQDSILHTSQINISQCVSVLLVCRTSTNPSLTPSRSTQHTKHTTHTNKTQNTHNITQHTTANRQPPTKNLRRLFGLLQFEFEFMVYGRSENKSWHDTTSHCTIQVTNRKCSSSPSSFSPSWQWLRPSCPLETWPGNATAT